MSDITISTNSQPEEKKQVQESDIKEQLKAVDEYEKLKAINDKLEAEYIRQQELKAKIALGGRANAGQYIKEKTATELAEEEAAKILKPFL
jgi:hypothetical protein